MMINGEVKVSGKNEHNSSSTDGTALIAVFIDLWIPTGLLGMI